MIRIVIKYEYSCHNTLAGDLSQGTKAMLEEKEEPKAQV